jgi:hypothetical protein
METSSKRQRNEMSVSSSTILGSIVEQRKNMEMMIQENKKRKKILRILLKRKSLKTKKMKFLGFLIQIPFIITNNSTT